MSSISLILIALLATLSTSCSYQKAKKRELAKLDDLQHQQSLETIGTTVHMDDQAKLLQKSQQTRRRITQLKNELDFLENQTKTTQEQQTRAKEIRNLLTEIQNL